MTSPLDEISFQLGQINAGLAIITVRADKQDKKIDDLFSLVATRADRRDRKLDDVAAAVGEIKIRMKPLAEDVKWMKPHVTHYVGLEKRVIGFGAFVMTVAGIVGGAIADWFFKKFT